MPRNEENSKGIDGSLDLDDFLGEKEPSQEDDLVAQLQSDLEKERDARREDQFVFIVVCTLLLDVVFFTVIDGLAAVALVLLELLILFPLAQRMGMEEIAGILSRVVGRVSDNVKGDR